MFGRARAPVAAPGAIPRIDGHGSLLDRIDNGQSWLLPYAHARPLPQKPPAPPLAHASSPVPRRLSERSIARRGCEPEGIRCPLCLAGSILPPPAHIAAASADAKAAQPF